MIPEESIETGIKVVAGNPTAAELAAVIAILQATHQEQVCATKRQVKQSASSWKQNTTRFRNDLRPGVGQWRAQYRPGLD
ncbi:MAG: hypothetical protein F2662_02885 [Actinobacteria bacterium]|uniref:Unannotated protein n=1 Tax=freshwater metagenome TaxID=449393 RepID=A0A6J6NN71_9ZZZZ|nr:hypothetical protein [Actinomycetota bacterium]